jgi:hypothetical protein
MAIGGPLKKAIARRSHKLLKQGGTYIPDRESAEHSAELIRFIETSALMVLMLP